MDGPGGGSLEPLLLPWLVDMMHECTLRRDWGELFKCPNWGNIRKNKLNHVVLMLYLHSLVNICEIPHWFERGTKHSYKGVETSP